METFQRFGSKNNSEVGRKFQIKAKTYLEKRLQKSFEDEIIIEIGISKKKKDHKFDLGVKDKIIVECKAHRWTTGNNTPSAKITVWNEAMYYFSLTPTIIRKILFIERHFSSKKGKTLGQYYMDTHEHLIPEDVEIWEYDIDSDTHEVINRI
jgi:hypothetical protein